jgi:hypothetical protein
MKNLLLLPFILLFSCQQETYKEINREVCSEMKEIYRVNKFGDEDPNGEYWVNQFGDCAINRKDGECMTVAEFEKQSKYSVSEFARIIKDKYPVYEKHNDSLLVSRILEKYPVYKNWVMTEAEELAKLERMEALEKQIIPKNDTVEKLKVCHDIKLKMELMNVEAKKGVYEIFWKMNLSAKESDVCAGSKEQIDKAMKELSSKTGEVFKELNKEK